MGEKKSNMENILVVGNRIFMLKSINDSIDSAIKSFYNLNLIDFAFDEELISKIKDHFIIYKYDFGTQDLISELFTPMHSFFIQENNYKKSQLLWKRLYDIYIEIEQKNNIEIHKGTLFYFWGVACLLDDLLDEAFILMHKAFQEELKHSDQPKAFPAYNVVTMNMNKINNYLYPWVLNQIEFLKIYLNKQNDIFEEKLDIESFYETLRSNLVNSEIVFYFSLAIAKLKKLLEFTTENVTVGFTGHILLNIIFDFILVFDMIGRLLLDEEVQQRASSREIIIRIFSLIQSRISDRDLNFINQNRRDCGLNTILDILYSERLPVNYSFITNSIEKDFAVLYSIRNHSAHNIDNVSNIINYRQEIAQSILNCLFLVIKLIKQNKI